MLLETEMTISAHLRRDPQKGKKEFSAHHGFSVIELMIAVAVLAIITSLALPSYRALIEKRQVTSGAQQVAAFLSSAQLEAVKRNEEVVVSYSPPADGSWCIGIDADDGVCDCGTDLNSCTVDGTPKVMNQDNLNYSEAMAGMVGDQAFAIDPVRGMMTDFTDGATFQFLSDPEQTYALNVTIGPNGRVSICSDPARTADETTAVPGFDPCQ
jgi:prepilin-type N-terminal cleavage/methylation domain-containing protein